VNIVFLQIVDEETNIAKVLTFDLNHQVQFKISSINLGFENQLVKTPQAGSSIL